MGSFHSACPSSSSLEDDHSTRAAHREPGNRDSSQIRAEDWNRHTHERSVPQTRAETNLTGTDGDFFLPGNRSSSALSFSPLSLAHATAAFLSAMPTVPERTFSQFPESSFPRGILPYSPSSFPSPPSPTTGIGQHDRGFRHECTRREVLRILDSVIAVLDDDDDEW